MKQAIVADLAFEKQPHEDEQSFYLGKLQAMKYFFHHELPLIAPWSELLTNLDTTCFDMQDAWF